MKFKLRDGELALPTGEKEAASLLADMFQNQGRVPDQDQQVEWEDMYKILTPKRNEDTVHSSEIRPLLQSSMEILIREPLEPLMIITGLFNRVQAKGLTTQVLAGALGGAVYAADVPEGGTYPENFFQVGGALQTAYIGKSGIQASFTDEALRYSTWDIFSMNLRMMGQALVRHKEKKASAFLSTLGTRLYDNADPTNSLFGVLTGRGLDMAANGSLTVDDLFRAMAHMAEEGFQPDVLLVNPLFFYQFLQDPIMRNMMMTYGGGSYFQKWQGNIGPRDPWSNGAMGAQGPSTGNKLIPSGAATGETPTGIVGREHGMNSGFPIPSYFPWSFRVEVSPLVPFDSETLLGDIYLLSSGNVGFFLVDEELTQVEWRDETAEIAKVKMRERYGFAIANEGQGVGVMKNVKLAKNYWDGTVKAITQEVLTEIGATDDVL
jgi:hypothetical protein